jgi:hypothetical protein
LTVTPNSEPRPDREPALLEKDFLLILSGTFAFLGLAVTPTFFLLGTIYEQSYWKVFGLDPGLFPLSNEWAGAVGFINTTALATAALIVIAGYALAFVVAQIISKGLSNLFPRGYAGDSAKHASKKAEDDTPADMPARSSDRRSRLISSVILATSIVIGVTVLATYQMEKSGRSEGEKDLKAFAYGDATKHNLKVRASILDRVHGNNVRVLDGYKIRCSEKWCAFYLNPIIEIIRTDDILSISIPALTELR